MATIDEIRATAATVNDPEINISIVELGLIYKIENNDGDVKIDMTLTSLMCPLGPQMVQGVKDAVGKLDGVKSVEVNMVWSPMWDPRTMASDDAKIELGII